EDAGPSGEGAGIPRRGHRPIFTVSQVSCSPSPACCNTRAGRRSRRRLMSKVTGTAYSGPIVIDFSDVEDDLTDLEPGARQRLRTEQEGIDGSLAELAKTVPVLGDKAGISPAVYQRVVAATDTIAKLRAHKEVLAKALEVVTESEAKFVHDRENDL